jgi:2-phosphoglycerate kinase
MTIYHTSLLILLSGTSGTGKSTLSNMLGATIKNSKLMSTDAFR